MLEHWSEKRRRRSDSLPASVGIPEKANPKGKRKEDARICCVACVCVYIYDIYTSVCVM